MTAPIDPEKLTELRYQLWTRICALADEAMSIADAWWELDPDLVELHYRRCGVSQLHLFEEETTADFEP
jgi:hypothetical protein